MKKRKIMPIILFATILILGGVSLCFLGRENKVPREFPALPPKRVEKELQKAALQKWGHEFFWKQLDWEGNLSEGGSSRYYGSTIRRSCRSSVFKKNLIDEND